MIIYYENNSKAINYSYTPDRNYKSIPDRFLRNTLLTIDHLYKTDALIITYTDEGEKKTIDIIDVLVADNTNNIRIVYATKNTYNGATNTVTYYDTHGVRFRKNHRKRWFQKNVGLNSPMCILAHELIHCYNEIYETQDYHARKRDKHMAREKITHKGHNLSYPNAEEEFVIRMTNQVARRLGEDVRSNYGRTYYETDSPITTRVKGKPKKQSIASIFKISKRSKF